jgi:hypothetical protein
MLYDVDARKMLFEDKFRTYSREAETARLAHAEKPARRVEEGEIELRLCRADDDPALERLAALAERPLPFGRLVVALVDGQLVAALPLAGGHALTDPFSRTAHLLRLLELRADQLRQPAPRRGALRLMRRHA